MKDNTISLPSYFVNVKTGCTQLHVSVSFLKEKPYRVLLQMGRSGGCHSAMMEAIARILNWGLRAGGSLHEAALQLQQIACQKPFGDINLSCLDGLGKALISLESEQGFRYEASAVDKVILEEVTDPSCPKGG